MLCPTAKDVLVKKLVVSLTLCLGLTACDQDSGDDGLSSAITQTTLNVLSADCAYGGVRIDSGTDANGDGQVTGDEVGSSETVCNGADAPAVDTALREVVLAQGLTGNPLGTRSAPSVDDPVAQLGMKLFFTKGLGGDQDAACVTCHHPFLGGGDDLSLPVGVAAEIHDLLGPGRAHSAAGTDFDGGPTVPRNAPTTFNMMLWDDVLFHDGRIESLTKIPNTSGQDGQIRTPDVAFGQVDPANLPNLTVAQARFPVTSPEEMRGFAFEAGNSNDDVRNHLAERLQGNTVPVELATNNWLEEFRTAFENPTGTAVELITYDNIALAIGTYENSQLFVDNAFKRYIDGDDTALSGDAKLGALMFYGESGCAGCHSGDRMTDEQFHVVAMPQIGRGKGNDNGVNTDDDFGRFRETGVEADRYAFRTPSMLNVAETGPWTHAGAYTTLEAVVLHHADPRAAVENYDFTQLDAGVQVDNMAANTAFALDQLDALRASSSSALPEITLDATDVSRLVAFLNALTDPCLQDPQCIGRWVPSVADTDPDGLRVQAVDRLGNPLAP